MSDSLFDLDSYRIESAKQVWNVSFDVLPSSSGVPYKLPEGIDSGMDLKFRFDGATSMLSLGEGDADPMLVIRVEDIRLRGLADNFIVLDGVLGLVSLPPRPGEHAQRMAEHLRPRVRLTLRRSTH